MAGSRTHRVPKLMVNTTDVETKWTAQDAATALVQTHLDTHTGTATIHRSINDAGAAVTDLWSADKITTMLAGKANTPLVIGDLPDALITEAKLAIHTAAGVGVDGYSLVWNNAQSKLDYSDRVKPDASNLAADVITPAQLNIDNAEVDTYVLSYDTASGKFKWVLRVDTNAGGLTAGVIQESHLNVHIAAGAGTDGWALYWDNGLSKLSYKRFIETDLSNVAADAVTEAMLNVFSHADAGKDGFVLSWDHANSQFAWVDISAAVAADTYKVKWDAGDGEGYLSAKLPKPTAAHSGNAIYLVADDTSTIVHGPALGVENLILNPECLIDQRNEGAAVVPTADGGTHTHRLVDGASAMISGLTNWVGSITRSTAIGNSRAALTVASSVPETVLGPSEYIIPYVHLFRGYDVAHLANTYVTVQFWFESNLNGTFSVCLQAGDSSRYYIQDFTHPGVGTTLVSKTFRLEAGATTITNSTTGTGLRLILFSCGGTDYRGTANAWYAGTRYHSASASQWVLNASYYLKFGGMQLFEGQGEYLPIVRKPYARYLAECQVYYRKSYSPGVVPATVTALGQYNWKNNGAGAAVDALTGVHFGQPMAGVPTITLYSPVTGASGKIRNETAGADVDSTAGNIGMNGCSYIDTGANTIAAGHIAGFHYTAEYNLT